MMRSQNRSQEEGHILPDQNRGQAKQIAKCSHSLCKSLIATELGPYQHAIVHTRYDRLQDADQTNLMPWFVQPHECIDLFPNYMREFSLWLRVRSLPTAVLMPCSSFWLSFGVKYLTANLLSITCRWLGTLSGWLTKQRNKSLGITIFDRPEVSRRAKGFPFVVCYHTSTTGISRWGIKRSVPKERGLEFSYREITLMQSG